MHAHYCQLQYRHGEMKCYIVMAYIITNQDNHLSLKSHFLNTEIRMTEADGTI